VGGRDDKNSLMAKTWLAACVRKTTVTKKKIKKKKGTPVQRYL
jgi:hypothetical protein